MSKHVDMLINLPGSIENVVRFHMGDDSVADEVIWVHPVNPMASNTWTVRDLYYRLLSEFSSMISIYKSRAKRHAFGFRLTDTILLTLWCKQRGRCKKSNMIMQFATGTSQNKNPLKISLDRIINSQGYFSNNIQFVTHFYNNSKSTWTSDQIDEYFVNVHETLRKKQLTEIMNIPV